MSEAKRGTVCADKRCKNKSYTCDKSFFRFPRDPTRARLWVNNCNREDLFDLEADKLYKSYRLCGDHFERQMFTNRLRKRLKPNAFPTLVHTLEASSKDWDHTYSSPEMVIQSSSILHNLLFFSVQSKKVQDSENQSARVQSFDPLQDTQLDEGDHQPPQIVYTSSSTQTSSKLLRNVPREKRFRLIIRRLRIENKRLKKKNQELLCENKALVKNINLEQSVPIVYCLSGGENMITI